MIHLIDGQTGPVERDSPHIQVRATRQGNSSDRITCVPVEKHGKGIFLFHSTYQYGALVGMRDGQHRMCRMWLGSCWILFFTALSLFPSSSSCPTPNCSARKHQPPGSGDAGDPSRGGPSTGIKFMNFTFTNSDSFKIQTLSGSAAEANRAGSVTPDSRARESCRPWLCKGTPF